MLDACTDSLAGIRDRALISFGFATAMRRSELVALEVSDLVPVEDGYRVVIRRSKGDQDRRSPCRAATGCARSSTSRRGWPRRRSPTGACSGASSAATWARI